MLEVIFFLILKILFIACYDYNFSTNYLNNVVEEPTEQELSEAEKSELIKYFGKSLETSDVFLNYQNISKIIEKYEDVNQSSFHLHNQQQLETFVKEITKKYPDITHSFSIGKSIQERELLVLVISKNPSKHTLLKPEISFVANIDGTEHEGRESLFLLAEFLCINYGKNKYLTKLVDEVRTHMFFSMNPDGYERTGDKIFNNIGAERNKEFCHLYNNFPYIAYGLVVLNCRETQKETEFFKKWMEKNSFVLSALLRTDSLVTLYPIEQDRRFKRVDIFDRKLLTQISYQYARAHPTMWKTGKRCISEVTDPFTQYHGIKHEFLHRVKRASMLDWISINLNTFAITVEMNCKVNLNKSLLATLWNQNKFSLISYMDLARYGIKGIVKSSKGEPLKDAKVEIIEGEKGKTINTTSEGEYWRLLAPGTYSIKFSHPTHAPEIFNFSIEARQLKIKNITLTYIGELRVMVYQLLFFTHH